MSGTNETEYEDNVLPNWLRYKKRNSDDLGQVIKPHGPRPLFAKGLMELFDPEGYRKYLGKLNNETFKEWLGEFEELPFGQQYVEEARRLWERRQQAVTDELERISTTGMTSCCPGSRTEVQRRGNLLDRSLLKPQEFWWFAEPWLRKAYDHGFMHDKPFEGLIYLWVTFNGWLGQIVADRTKAEKDWYLIEAAGQDTMLNDKFRSLMVEDTEFSSTVKQFARLWPVFKVRALQDHGLKHWNGNVTDRPNYLRECFMNNWEKGDFSPTCFREHQPDPSDPRTFSSSNVPRDWSHTLSAIYKVRCNLFHGGKSFSYSGDGIFVKFAFLILWQVWGKSHLKGRGPDH